MTGYIKYAIFIVHGAAGKWHERLLRVSKKLATMVRGKPFGFRLLNWVIDDRMNLVVNVMLANQGVCTQRF